MESLKESQAWTKLKEIYLSCLGLAMEASQKAGLSAPTKNQQNRLCFLSSKKVVTATPKMLNKQGERKKENEKMTRMRYWRGDAGRAPTVMVKIKIKSAGISTA